MFKSAIEQRKLYFWIIICSKVKVSFFKSAIKQIELCFWTTICSKVQSSLFKGTFELRKFCFWTNLCCLNKFVLFKSILFGWFKSTSSRSLCFWTNNYSKAKFSWTNFVWTKRVKNHLTLVLLNRKQFASWTNFCCSQAKFSLLKQPNFVFKNIKI